MAARMGTVGPFARIAARLPAFGTRRREITAYVIGAVWLVAACVNVAIFNSTAPVSGFVLAVIFTTWYGGLRPGLVVTGVSLLVLGYLFFSDHELHAYPAKLSRLFFFAFIAAFLVWIIVSERRANAALRRMRDELQRSNEALTRENIEGKALEESLRHNAAELRLVIDTIPAMAWSLHPDGKLEFLNRRWLEYTGLSLESGLEEANSTMHPEDSPRMLTRWEGAQATSEGFDEEVRLRRADGVYRWFLVRLLPLFDENRRVLRWYGTSTDIEDRKLAEEGLQRLSRRLFEVHEEERRRFSRELHDEFGQLLATIGLHLQAARGMAGKDAQPSLEAAADVLQRAGREVRNLALEMRPTMLESAGLDAALLWLARQTDERTGIATRVVGKLGDVSPERAVALFRVVQQAVTNAVQHAKATHIWIELLHDDGFLEVMVRDDGVGFDVARTVASAPWEGHLGLLGMKERVQFLGGEFQIDSRPGAWSRVRVRIPGPTAANDAK